MTEDVPKRKIGRPRIGEMTKVFLPPAVRAFVEDLAKDRGEQRGTTLRHIVTNAVQLIREGHFTLPLPKTAQKNAESIEAKRKRFGDVWYTCGRCGMDYGGKEEHVCKPPRKPKKKVSLEKKQNERTKNLGKSKPTP